MEKSTATSPSPNELAHPGDLRWILICDPGDPRADEWRRAVRAQPGTSLAVLDYRALVAVEPAPGLVDSGAVVRFDSPGRATDIHIGLLMNGAAAAVREGGPAISEPDVAADLHRRGAIVYPRQWYLGYRRLLESVDTRLGQGAWRASDARDIALFYDKPRCHEHLRRHGIPVARSLGHVDDHDHLRSRMRDVGCTRVFVKLAHGSAASGVMAYRTSPMGDRAWTTTELVDTPHGRQPHNTRRVRRLSDVASIASVVNALAAHRLHVETWVPKAGIEGATFDLRIVAIAGMPRHVVIRRAHGPITNLHLGNQRGPGDALRRAMSQAAWSSLMATCAATARLFPRTLQIALDVAVMPDLRDHCVLEVNAFGDLLHQVTDGGASTYAAQLTAARSIIAAHRAGQPREWTLPGAPP